MTRFRADLLLLLAAIIWGTTFVVQKIGMDGIGPFGFSGCRMVLSLLVVLPFVLREQRMNMAGLKLPFWPCAGLCVALTAGVILQQAGLMFTSATNGGFLTGLYVVMTPFVVWVLQRRRPSWFIGPAVISALLGLWLINGASLVSWNRGDTLVVLCSVCFALHITLMGFVMQKAPLPFTMAALQYFVCAVLALPFAFIFEGLSAQGVAHNLYPLLYAGIISGGIAYTIQPIAQQYTPSSDTAIILSGEALFAALAGYFLLDERLTAMGWTGCGLVFLAILLVEAGPLLRRRV